MVLMKMKFLQDDGSQVVRAPRAQVRIQFGENKERHIDDSCRYNNKLLSRKGQDKKTLYIFKSSFVKLNTTTARKILCYNMGKHAIAPDISLIGQVYRDNKVSPLLPICSL